MSRIALWRGIGTPQFGYLPQRGAHPPPIQVPLARTTGLGGSSPRERRVFVRKLTPKFAIAGIGAATAVALLAADRRGTPCRGRVLHVQAVDQRARTRNLPQRPPGFTKVVNAPFVSTGTSVTGCPDGAQEEFREQRRTTQPDVRGVVLRIGGGRRLHRCRAGSPTRWSRSESLRSPSARQLSHDSRQYSTYLIAWRNGSAVEVTGLSTAMLRVPPQYHDEHSRSPYRTEQEGAGCGSDTTEREIQERHGFLRGSSTSVSAADAKAQTAANAASVAAGCPKNPSDGPDEIDMDERPGEHHRSAKTYTATGEDGRGDHSSSRSMRSMPRKPSTISSSWRSIISSTASSSYGLSRRSSIRPETRRPPEAVDPGYTIPDELPAKASNAAHQYPLGSVAMANTGQPHTGGSQWFIVAGAEGESLANSYSLFGHVTSGMGVVKKINAQGSSSGVPPDVTHRMLKVTISSS